MIKYRPQRGGLDEAMAEAREFDTVEDMKRHILQEWAVWNTDGITMFDMDDIVIGEILGDDDRIGWKNVRHICVNRIGGNIYEYPQCIGWCGE